MRAPVALFVYNRPWHSRQTIEALQANALAWETELYIFSDGPRAEADVKKVEEVRNYVRSVNGFQSVHIVESNVNQGLARSIIAGLTNVLQTNGSIIVLEDDMVTSPFFLTYMNRALDLYENETDVISIHGYVYPVKEALPETFFLKGADCWGWSTWKRGWDLFEENGSVLLQELKHKALTHEFDFYGTYPYTRMLEKQIRGENDSWAIRWYASAFLKNKLTLYPGKSLVRNIGNDTSGTHTWDNARFDQHVLAQSIELHKLEPKEDVRGKEIISDYFKSTAPSLLKKVFSRLRFLFR
jgi:hypothetical protein